MNSILHFLGQEIDLFYIDTAYAKDHDRYKGIPVFYNQGGQLYFEFPYGESHERLLERMLTIDYEVYELSYPVDDGKIVFYDSNGYILKTWKFKDAPIVNYKVTFDPNGMGLMVKMVISPAIQDYGCKVVRNWHVTPIEEETYQSPVVATEQEEKKPFRINIKANKRDIKEGIFGFDTIPDKNIVESDYEKLKKEYKPLSEKILSDEYIPNWLSIRKDQTVELELDWTKKGRADDYNTISFEEHSDFTFEPVNLKDAKKVNITCNNNNENPVQILIKADDELTVGALNIFYPKPKTIDLEWCFVEIQGDEKDQFALGKEIKKSDLENYLKKGLNPALIDFNISNNEATIVDISEHLENFKKYRFLKKHLDDRIGNYIERSKKGTVLQKIITTHKEDKNKLTVYFINQKCINEKDIKEDGQFNTSGGISPTNTGVAFLVLDPAGHIKSENIIHEIMHALGLEHTFESKHKIKKTKTDNYMDYDNTKKHTYKWQWETIQQYAKLK